VGGGGGGGGGGGVGGLPFNTLKPENNNSDEVILGELVLPREASGERRKRGNFIEDNYQGPGKRRAGECYICEHLSCILVRGKRGRRGSMSSGFRCNLSQNELITYSEERGGGEKARTGAGALRAEERKNRSLCDQERADTEKRMGEKKARQGSGLSPYTNKSAEV